MGMRGESEGASIGRRGGSANIGRTEREGWKVKEVQTEVREEEVERLALNWTGLDSWTGLDWTRY